MSDDSNINTALSALYAILAERGRTMWPEDRKAIQAAIDSLQRYG